MMNLPYSKGTHMYLLGALICVVIPAEKSHAEVSLQPQPAVLRRVFDAAPGTVLVRFAEPPGARVFAAHQVAEPAEAILERLLEPKRYQRALPSFVKVETITNRFRSPGQTPDQLVAWELEIPLWNLSGRLWIKPFDHAVQIRLVEGAFAPGVFLFRVIPLGPRRSILTVEGHADPVNANWATRRIARSHPLAQPAMTVAAVTTLLRALALDVTELAGAHPERWPSSTMTAPALTQLDARILANVLTWIGTETPIGLVHVAPGGRLSHVQVGWNRNAPASVIMDRLFQPDNWQALPGWRRVIASPASQNQHGTAVRWAVRSQFPFVDFSTTWDVIRGRALRARADLGDGRIAVWGWDAFENPAHIQPPHPIIVHTVHPRLDGTGYLPRKFIEKEPLLEHGLALALAYVNTMILLDKVGPPVGSPVQTYQESPSPRQGDAYDAFQ